MALSPPLHVPQVVQNLEKALLSADPEVEKLFLAAFGDVVLDPKYLHGDEAVQIVSASSSFNCAYTQKLTSFLVWDRLSQIETTLRLNCSGARYIHQPAERVECRHQTPYQSSFGPSGKPSHA